MAARKNRNRQRRRRGRFGFLYKLLSFLIIFAALVVGCVVFFRVNEITVEGNSRYTAQEIIAASGVKVGDNLFLINNPQTVRAITRALPYVEKVSPVKTLPDTLEIHITESRACAWFETGEGFWLINAGGKAVELTQDREKTAGLPEILGLTTLNPVLGAPVTAQLEEQVRLEGLKGLLTALNGKGMAQNVTSFVDLSSTNAIYFDYGSDLTVVVPMSGDFDWCAAALKGTLDTCQKQGQLVIGTLDLTYGDKVAHLLPDRWLPETMGAAPSESPVPPEELPEEPEEGTEPSPEPTAAEGEG